MKKCSGRASQRRWDVTAKESSKNRKYLRNADMKSSCRMKKKHNLYWTKRTRSAEWKTKAMFPNLTPQDACTITSQMCATWFVTLTRTVAFFDQRWASISIAMWCANFDPETSFVFNVSEINIFAFKKHSLTWFPGLFNAKGMLRHHANSAWSLFQSSPC